MRPGPGNTDTPTINSRNTGPNPLKTTPLFGLVLLLLAGCESGPPPVPPLPHEGVELVVAALGDISLLEAIRVQTGEWERDTGARLDIRSDAVDLTGAASADLILFPGDQMGALVDAGLLTLVPESAIRPSTIFGNGNQTDPNLNTPSAEESDVPAKRDPLDYSDVVLPFRDLVTKYGEDRFALPLGGSSLVLAYRRDAFRSQVNLAAAKAAGLELEPPTTWEQLDALARFFQGRDWNADGTPDFGISAALGTDAEGMGSDIFVARAAASGQPADQYALLFDPETLEPRIDSPPFVEALQALVNWKQAGPPELSEMTPEAARAAFREGRTALLIDRPERAQQWTDPRKPVDVAVAPLPGSTRVFDPTRKTWTTPRIPNRIGFLRRGGGWLGGVNARSDSRKSQAALALLVQLASPEIAQEIVSDPAFPMTPVRTSNLALGLPDPRSAVGVDNRGWGQAVLDTFGAPRTVVSLRIPQSLDYLHDLETARLGALKGEAPEAVLKATADQWKQRSVALGLDRQIWHYRRSLNKLSTTSQPPAAPGSTEKTKP